MNAIGRCVLFSLAAVLSACGSGSGTQPAVVAAPALNSASSSKTKIAGKATLTIRFPANFRRAVGTTAKASKLRHPAFVDPTPGAQLYIWVDKNPAPGSPYFISPDPDGTQTFNSIPVLSGNSNNIVVVETDGVNNLYALGEYDYGGYSNGSSDTIALTMQMNVTGFAITLNSDGSNAYVMDGGTYAPNCLSGPVSENFYLYAVDRANGYGAAVGPSGVGGVPPITVGGNVIGNTYPATTSAGTTQAPGVYQIKFDANNNPFNLTASAQNPAWQMINQWAPFGTANSELYNSPSFYASGSSTTFPSSTSVSSSVTFEDNNGC